MPITPVPGPNGIIGPAEIGSVQNGLKSSAPASADFGQVLLDALDQVSQTEAAANDAITKLASGEDIELHQVTMAVQQADIAFQLALQVRNKIVEAYQEVMRMQV
jgi:flagellar hook-basal body complex protein FliE